ncbi:MAG TPA: MraY family glycosyltransferase, partial [Bacteroidia bacterium]|nr:MraY family glycosyltransferase [Bacteroidia bacterium]
MKEFFSNNYYSVVYCTYFAAAVVFSFLIYSLLLRFVKTLGIRNNDDGTIIRWGSMSKPAIGGIGFYIVFLLSVASYSTFFASNETLHNSSFIGLLLSMAAGFLIGLADDAYNTRPLLKFSVQVLCGVILIASGVHINFFEQNIFNYLLTLLWVVGIMNSINMLDNMDGITTIVSIAIVEAAIFITLMHYDVTSINLIILVGLLSSLIAFLYYNWNPSRMYMGDTGSQFLGVFLA